MDCEVEARLLESLVLELIDCLDQFHPGFGIGIMDKGRRSTVRCGDGQASQIIFVDRMVMDIDHTRHDVFSQGVNHPACFFSGKAGLNRSNLFTFDPYICLLNL